MSPPRLKISFINFWPEKSPKDYWLYQLVDQYICPDPIITNTKPDIAFISIFGYVPQIRNFIKYEKPKMTVFFTGENTEFENNQHKSTYNNYLLDKVDLAIGFKCMEHPKYIRLPLWMAFGNFKKKLGEPGHSWEELKQYHDNPKTKFCCLISRNDYNGIRKKLASILNSIDHVDCPGGLLHNTGDFHLGPSWTQKFEFMKDYQFCVCPENSEGDGYTTEKLFHALACGCIPVYWGSHGDPEFFDHTKIINAATITDTESLMKEIRDRRDLKLWNRDNFMLPGTMEKVEGIIDSVIEFITNHLNNKGIKIK